MWYRYGLNEVIRQNIQRLTVLHEVLDLTPIPPSLITQLRAESLLQSAVFSAKIEGVGENERNREVQQLLSTYRYIHSHHSEPVTLDLLKTLHAKSMEGLVERAGLFRTEMSGIFNVAGVAVYVPPPPHEILPRLTEMIEWTIRTDELIPVKAAVAHFWFEKIHPFLDGNGRVGRLLSAYILYRGRLGFRGLLAVEQVIEQQRELYYDLLSNEKADLTSFIAFYVDCLLEAGEKLKQRINQAHSEPSVKPQLPARQRELFQIIQDHPDSSFDFLWRRFQSVPKSTLHYDVAQLVKKGFVQKIGSTRGTRYQTVIELRP